MAGSNKVNENLKHQADRLKTAIYALSEAYALKMEGHAKRQAPWTDRTGAARKGLFGYTIADEKQFKTRIAHTMEYGPILELARQGKFAILQPTVDKFTPDYLRDIERLVTGK